MPTSPPQPPICKYYPSHPRPHYLPPSQPVNPAISRKKPRHRSSHSQTSLSPSTPPKSRPTSSSFLPPPLQLLISRFYPHHPPSPIPQSRTSTRPSSFRKHPYLHILLFPALLLLLLEVPFPFFRESFGFAENSVLPVTFESSNSLIRPLDATLSPRANFIDVAHAIRASDQTPVNPGVSIVAGCMNRHETLARVLQEWRNVDHIAEILIVDWGSQPPLKDVVGRVAGDDQRVRVLKVEDEERWVLSRAYNLAIRAARFERVIRMDCDYGLRNGFLEAHGLDKGVFYAGNYQKARNENEVHLNGAVYLWREDFVKVGGYDERIQSYGWDDEDLYGRLVESGLEKRDISYDFVKHVPHEDGERRQKDVLFVQVEIDLNALLLKHLPKWNKSAVDRNEWTVEQKSERGWGGGGRYAVLKAVVRPRGLKELVAPENVQNAWNMALGQRLANDYQIPWDIMETMDVESKKALLTRLNNRMRHRISSQPARVLFAHLMHGLGNRLRALGSAMSFAKETDRELVVIWETDAHIAANFSELFDDDFVVLENFKPKWPFHDYDKWDKAWLSFEFFNYMEMEGQGANKGQMIVDQPDKHFYFKSAYVMEADPRLTGWERDNAMLKSLKPVKEVLEMIKSHENEGLEGMIGVHIRDRTLDRDIKNVNFGIEYGAAASRQMEYWRRKSCYKTFMEEMHLALKKDEKVRFYVATDTVEVMGKIKNEFGDHVVFTERNCDGRDGHCVRFALVDIICLAKCRELIGSNWSSFTEAALRFGGKKVRLAGRDFGVDMEGIREV